MEPQTDAHSPYIQLPKLHNWGEDQWREKAFCRGKDTNWFFPENESLEGLTLLQKKRRKYVNSKTDPDGPSNRLSQARLLCARCEVRDECLKFALENCIAHGMWGGQPPRDRRRMTVDNFDTRIPVSKIMKDIHRIRNMRDKDNQPTLAHDVAVVLDVSTGQAERMLRDNALPEFI